nr:MAG TPA: Protein of unknown function (DUF3951) [Microviridae sp.]
MSLSQFVVLFLFIAVVLFLGWILIRATRRNK